MKKRLTSALIAAVITASAQAAVSPEEASALGDTLTPMGAEKAGNETGTIPPWEGGITTVPEGYREGQTHIDPFSADPVLFTITASNAEQHSEHLTDGQRALLNAHPDTLAMPVYPTRRSASYPQYVYDAAIENATSASVITEGRGAIRGARVAPPFPIPKQGVEVVWNHNLRWRSAYVDRINGQVAVTPVGRYTRSIFQEQIAFVYNNPKTSPVARKYPDLAWAARQKTIAPARTTGFAQLVYDSTDHNASPRAAWIFNAGLNRIFRAPFVGYDNIASFVDGLRFSDEFDMFNGAPNRFEWELKGKREVYIPYNAYRLNDDLLDDEDILGRNHLNPENLRYELHRVWVVEGTLKPEERHTYSRRVFYMDEDTWQIALAEGYDSDGNLKRVSEAHIMNYYQEPAPWTALEAYYDLDHNRYLVTGLDNGYENYKFGDGAEGKTRLFSPNALKYYVR